MPAPHFFSPGLQDIYDELCAGDPEAEAAFAEAVAEHEADLEMIRQINAALAEVMMPNYIETWWDTPCEAFGGESATDLWLRGELPLVLQVAMTIGNGEPT